MRCAVCSSAWPSGWRSASSSTADADANGVEGRAVARAALPCSAAPMRACETAHHPSPAPSWSSQQRTLVLRPAPALAANGLGALAAARAPPGCS